MLIKSCVRVVIKNVSSALKTASGEVPLLLAPGVFAAHNSETMQFMSGSKASPGLEALAEDGDPSMAAKEWAHPTLGQK